MSRAAALRSQGTHYGPSFTPPAPPPADYQDEVSDEVLEALRRAVKSHAEVYGDDIEDLEIVDGPAW